MHDTKDTYFEDSMNPTRWTMAVSLQRLERKFKIENMLSRHHNWFLNIYYEGVEIGKYSQFYCSINKSAVRNNTPIPRYALNINY